MDTGTTKVVINRRRNEGPFAYRRELGQSAIRRDNSGADRQVTVDPSNIVSGNTAESADGGETKKISVADLVRKARE